MSLIALLILGGSVAHAFSQESSVKPGINDSFQGSEVSTYVERFESEGREVYDQRHEIVESCRLEPGMVVADVGAGTGLFTRLMADAVGKRGKVLAVDITPKFVDHTVRTSREQGFHNVEGVVCTADDARLPENSVDVVFISDTYHHFEFPLKTMRSIYKALKPGGSLIVLDFEREADSSEWIREHVRAGKSVVIGEIESAGFRKTGENDTLLKENYFLTFSKTAPSRP